MIFQLLSTFLIICEILIHNITSVRIIHVPDLKRPSRSISLQLSPHDLVGRVGFEPTAYQSYGFTVRCLQQFGTPAHVHDGYGAWTPYRLSGFAARHEIENLLSLPFRRIRHWISVKGLEPLVPWFLATCVCHFRHTDVYDHRLSFARHGIWTHILRLRILRPDH